MNHALFLDRDGVINKDFGYIYKKQDIIFNKGIFELVRKAKKLGYYVIVITNQSGIARGYFTEEDFNNLMNWMNKKFEENDGKIDKVYYCPYHQDGKIKKYAKIHSDRKPNPGMIIKACKDFNIDPKKSMLVGDKKTDIEAGVNASISKSIFLGNHEMNIAYKSVNNLTDVIKELSR